MDNLLENSHPNPGWNKQIIKQANQNSNPTELIGKHYILELYGCEEGKLNDENYIKSILKLAASFSGATLLNLITHKFYPQGVTGLALLAESHISIHTWPEVGYAAVDVFTCGKHTMPDKACELLKRELFAQKFSLRTLRRETPSSLNELKRTIAN
tara:strand:+ start:734 stop:1201 length:468 start_codon:yes stop_codon:yes gene_type:complete